jgi:Tat protein secretion system quality control protein TatD with DNase activity
VQLTRLRGTVGRSFWFGFSAVINLRDTGNGGESAAVQRVRNVIQAVPRDRVLVESDLEDIHDAVADIQRMVAFIAAAWGVNEAAVVRQTRTNALEFLTSF